MSSLTSIHFSQFCQVNSFKARLGKIIVCFALKVCLPKVHAEGQIPNLIIFEPGGFGRQCGSDSKKNLPAMQEIQVQSLEDPLEKEMASHFSILAWKILWTKEPRGLKSMGLQRVNRLSN